MTKKCCLCERIEIEGSWQRLPAMDALKVSHVYCPLCYEILMDEVERFAMQNLSRPVYSVINMGHLQAA